MRTKDNRIKVRFNLGAGKHFKHWKIEYPNGEVKFVDPSKENLVMIGCQLHNQKGTAAGIHAGGEKVVCAWILCEHLSFGIFDETDYNKLVIKFNPRVLPYWVNDEGDNLDKREFGIIQSEGKNLFAYLLKDYLVNKK